MSDGKPFDEITIGPEADQEGMARAAAAVLAVACGSPLSTRQNAGHA